MAQKGSQQGVAFLCGPWIGPRANPRAGPTSVLHGTHIQIDVNPDP